MSAARELACPTEVVPTLHPPLEVDSFPYPRGAQFSPLYLLPPTTSSFIIMSPPPQLAHTHIDDAINAALNDAHFDAHVSQALIAASLVTCLVGSALYMGCVFGIYCPHLAPPLHRWSAS